MWPIRGLWSRIRHWRAKRRCFSCGHSLRRHQPFGGEQPYCLVSGCYCALKVYLAVD